MSKFLFKKAVDLSLLKYGTTIPKDLKESILENLSASLSRGEQTAVEIVIAGASYNATVTFVDLKDQPNREVFQIRYPENSNICKKLNEIFSHTASIVFGQKGADGEGSTSATIPEPEKEYIELFALEKDKFEFRCMPKTTVAMKSAFLKYLGTETDLSGYQRSYKLVFYKCFFERLGEGQDVAAYVLTQAFRKYYIDRKNAGLLSDVDADPVIGNIETSSVESVYKLILKNPFAAISGKGFISQKQKNDKAYFVINPQLREELSGEDIKRIIALVDKKLDFYYSKIDNQPSQDGPMRMFVNKILNEYVPAKSESFAGHPMGTFFRNDIPNTIYSTGIVNSKTHLITGSVGQGNWATIPWICIFDRSVTTSAQSGVYIVYLLSKDGSSLYLTFNQGCTDINKGHSRKETIQIMHHTAKEIRNRVDARGFNLDDGVVLGSGLSGLGEFYQEGAIFYKEYKKGTVPTEDVLRKDLADMMEIYADYVSGDESSDDEWWPSRDEYSPGISKKQWLELLQNREIFYEQCLNAMAQLYDIGGQASCVQLSERYGKKTDHYRAVLGVHLAIRIWKETGCPLCNQENAKYWPVLFVGRDTKPEERGNYIWKLRDELKQALEEFEIWNYLPADGGEEEVAVKDTIVNIKNYIAAKGFSYEDGLIENFYLSLKSKPFVILAGTSGAGKTRLVKLFAEAVGATTGNGRYKMVSVRPDWSDSSDLFGHVDLNGKFIPGAIIDFVKQAEIDNNRPYFLCLDEMNLARVEYYLSDILSVIETRDFAGATIQSDPLVSDTYYGSDLSAAGRYGTVRLPENLYIIGTVNMDETTFPFSRKVLDRANTIEFSYVDLMPDFEKLPHDPHQTLNLSNSFLKTEYLLLAQCADEREAVNSYCLELQKINRVLQKANAHVGYRVRDEIVFYLLNNKKHELLEENEAMDNELMQKILPRIQGSSVSIKAMLCDLFKHCAGDYDGYQVQSDNVSDKMRKALNDADRKIKYRHSAAKIELMTRRFEEDGFTSYWL